MGLSSAQAKYLFISSRIIDVQGALMRNANTQLQLTDKANDIAEAKEYAINVQQWQFNGNSQFDYNTLMDNEYYLVSNDGRNNMVLNNVYAKAAQAAGVAQNGGNYSIEGLDKFMQSMGINPSQQSQAKGFSNWQLVAAGKVQNNTETQNAQKAEYNAKEAELKAERDSFYETYGKKAPTSTEYKTRTENKEKYTTYSYISATDFAKKLGKANLTGGVQESGTATTHDIEKSDWNNMTWEKIMTGQQTVLSLGNYTTTHYDYQNDVVSKVNTIIQNLGATVKSAVPSIPSDKVDTAVNKTKQQYSKDSKDYNSGRNYDTFINQSSNSSTAQIESSESRDSGTWHHSERRYAVDLKDLFNYFFNQLKTAMGAAADNVLCVGTENERVTSYNYYNEAGKTADEWNAGYSALLPEVRDYIEKGTVPVTIEDAKFNYPEDQDVATMQKYQRIFEKICSQGWVADNDLGQGKLAEKLENNQYFIQYQDNKATTMNMFAEFTKVNANNKDDIEAYYKKQEQKIEREEKKLSVEQTSLQTELSSLQTEEASVKSIIDKNIERGFNLFG